MITEQDLAAARERLQGRMDAATGGGTVEDVDHYDEATMDAAANAQLSGLDIDQPTLLAFSRALIIADFPMVPPMSEVFAALAGTAALCILIGLQTAATTRQAEEASQ